MWIRNIFIKRNPTYNNVRNHPIMLGNCTIDRIEYKISLWLKENDNGKFFQGVMKNENTIGKIYLYKNKNNHPKAPIFKGMAFRGEEGYQIALWMVKKVLIGKIEYDERIISKEIKEAKIQKKESEKTLLDKIIEANK